MRRALVALGGGEEKTWTRTGTSSTSTTADAYRIRSRRGELRREIQLWEHDVQERESTPTRLALPAHARGDAPSSRGGRADVGGAAAAARRIDAGVSGRAPPCSPARRRRRRGYRKLPSRALWDDLSRRLLAAARVAAETDEALLAAATSLSGQLAHTFFMPFALVAVASIARLRTCLHQLIVDVVSTYNILTPLLGGGNMPPPGLLGDSADAGRAPESLRCEWSTVTPPPPPPGANPPRENAEGKARRPKVRVVEFETNAVGGIHDEDWNWRLLRRAGGEATGAATASAKTTRFDKGGEDLGAAVPRSVRGLEAVRVERGGSRRNPPRRRTRVCVRSGDRASRRAARSGAEAWGKVRKGKREGGTSICRPRRRWHRHLR